MLHQRVGSSKELEGEETVEDLKCNRRDSPGHPIVDAFVFKRFCHNYLHYDKSVRDRARSFLNLSCG